MAPQTINGSTGFIPGLGQTVDPDESPDRADAGYTGVDPSYQNAASKTYAPQGNVKLVPEAKAFGQVDPEDVSDEQKAADEAQAAADEAQAAAHKAAADKAAEEAAKRVEQEKERVASTPATTPVTTVPTAPSTKK